MYDNEIDHIGPAQKAVKDRPADRVPVHIADDHGKSAAKGEARLDGLLDDGPVFHSASSIACG